MESKKGLLSKYVNNHGENTGFRLTLHNSNKDQFIQSISLEDSVFAQVIFCGAPQMLPWGSPHPPEPTRYIKLS